MGERALRADRRLATRRPLTGSAPLIARSSAAEVAQALRSDALVLCCGSFEDRCLAAPRAISNCDTGETSIPWIVIEIDDDKSFFREECERTREKNVRQLKTLIGEAQGVLREGSLNQVWPLSRLKTLVETLVKVLENHSGPVILDITTMPKELFFAVIRELAELDGSRELFVAYTTAQDYGSELSRDFEDVAYLGGFIGNYAAGLDLAWIPIFGFQGGLANKIYDWGRFGSRVSPIVGFPSLAVDRVLYANREIINRLEGGIDTLSYCPIDNPAWALRRVKELATRLRERGFYVSVSPLGTKLLSLGACLAAIELGLPVLYAQPRTYHPAYSSGAGQTHWFQMRVGKSNHN